MATNSSVEHGEAVTRPPARDIPHGSNQVRFSQGKLAVPKKLEVLSVKKVRNLPGVPGGCTWCPTDGMVYFYLEHGSRRDTWAVAVNGQRLHKTPYQNSSYLTWSPSGKQFVYVPVAYVPEVYRFLTIMDIGSGMSRQISHQRMCGQSSWSPDGKVIAFEAWPKDVDRVKGPPGTAMGLKAIWIVNADGTGERQIVEQGYQPKWFPDGKRIGYIGQNGFILVKPDGTDPQVLPVRLTRGPSGGWDLSPDGKRVAHGQVLEVAPSGETRRCALLVYYLEDGKDQVLFETRGVINGVSWSLDGKHIAFCGSDAPPKASKPPVPDYVGIVTVKEVTQGKPGHAKSGAH